MFTAAMIACGVFIVGWLCWVIGSMLWIVGCFIEQFFG